jgi:crotonobetainyl-CoA:carnitine CoA-transferase CaiB-like acyl-CoA transferase
MELVGLGGDERFASFEGRVAHREEVDRRVADWIGRRSRDEVLVAFDAAHAAAAPVYDMADIFADEHFAARGAIERLDGVPMQGLIARLSVTPGALRWAGRPVDADGDSIRAELQQRGGRRAR